MERLYINPNDFTHRRVKVDDNYPEGCFSLRFLAGNNYEDDQLIDWQIQLPLGHKEKVHEISVAFINPHIFNTNLIVLYDEGYEIFSDDGRIFGLQKF